MTTALVTGGTGFLGSALARRLAGDGVTVRVLARATSNRRRLDGVGVEWATGDVTDRDSVSRAMEGVERVFHSAALYELGTADPERMRAINVDGTRNVLETAVARGAAAVHVSSVIALGPTGPEAVGERHWSAALPESSYARTKRAAHEIARGLAAAGANVSIALPGTIYGPDDPSLVALANKLYANRAMPGVSIFPDMKMSLVHVDDCAEAIVRLSERARPGEELIVVGQVVTFGEWFEKLAAVTGRRKPITVPGWLVKSFAPVAGLAAPLAGLRRDTVREGMALSGGNHWAFSNALARARLDWTPRPLDEGLAEVMHWYRHR